MAQRMMKRNPADSPSPLANRPDDSVLPTFIQRNKGELGGVAITVQWFELLSSQQTFKIR